MQGKCLKSIYRPEGEFYLKILDEQVTTPTGFDNIKEPCFKVQVFEGQGFDNRITWLRKSLIGKLYEIVEIPKQFLLTELTMFDFMGGII